MRQDSSQLISTGTEKNVSSDMYGTCERGGESRPFTVQEVKCFLANQGGQ